ncbi:type IV pilus assembly protein PilM [Syntrophus aciditrophicus]|nr:type IV pilus assembly protein PilM [Syntrophus aciditrophicus]
MLDLKSLLSGSRQVVGLDIGSSSLKLAEVVDDPRGGYLLNRFSQLSLPRGIIVDGILHETSLLTEKVKELFKTSGNRRKGIVTSLSGHSVIIKKVDFPTMEEEEMRDMIRDDAAQYLPFDNMDEVNFDFQILGENEYNPNLMEVLLVAARKDIINSYTDALKAAGLTVVIMDVDSFALETVYEENYDFEEEDIVALINIGASITNINVVKADASIFTRDFTLGGNTVTESLVDRLGVSFDEAERVKIEGPGGDEFEANAFRMSLIEHAEPICAEIDRSIEFFRSTFGGDYIRKVLLSGGGAKLPGIVEELRQRLGVDTEILNPFQKIAINDKTVDVSLVEQMGPALAVSLGLALRRVGDK